MKSTISGWSARPSARNLLKKAYLELTFIDVGATAAGGIHQDYHGDRLRARRAARRATRRLFTRCNGLALRAAKFCRLDLAAARPKPCAGRPLGRSRTASRVAKLSARRAVAGHRAEDYCVTRTT